MDQPGKVANPARGQLNTENDLVIYQLEPFDVFVRFSCLESFGRRKNSIELYGSFVGPLLLGPPEGWAARSVTD